MTSNTPETTYRIGEALTLLSGLPSAVGHLVDSEEIFQSCTRLSTLQTIMWLIQFPTDLLYRWSKRASIENVLAPVLEASYEEYERSRSLRIETLKEISSQKSQTYNIPFPLKGDHSAPEGRFKIFGRSMFVPVTMSDGSGWNLVFKGITTGKGLKRPINLSPEKMDFSKNKLSFGYMEPQPPWVVVGCETFHTGKNEFFNALALGAVKNIFDGRYTVPIPVGLFRLSRVPVVENNKIVTRATEDYFEDLVLGLSRRERIQLLRFLRLDLEDSLSDEDQRIFTRAFSFPMGRAAGEALRRFIRRWNPVVYVYLMKGDASVRLETWNVEIDRGINEHIPLTFSRLKEALGFSNPEISVLSIEDRVSLLDTFVRQLSDCAFWNSLGGDFGTRQAALHPKDVTPTCGLLDLHANMVPGGGSLIYHLFLHRAKSAFNRLNAKQSVSRMASALNLDTKQENRGQDLFRRLYRKKFGIGRRWLVGI